LSNYFDLLFKLKTRQNLFSAGAPPRTSLRWGAYDAPPDTLFGLGSGGRHPSYPIPFDRRLRCLDLAAFAALLTLPLVFSSANSHTDFVPEESAPSEHHSQITGLHATWQLLALPVLHSCMLFSILRALNPLECTGSYSATSNDMQLVHWPLMGGLLHFVERGGDWAGPQPAQAPLRCTKCNSPPIIGQCTNHCIAV